MNIWIIVVILAALLTSAVAAEACDPTYPVCFDTDADPSVPNPIQLKDLASFTPALFTPRTHGGGGLHWPGAVWKVDDSGLINYRAGVGRTEKSRSSAMIGSGTPAALPCPPADANCPGQTRAPRNPANPAKAIINGKGASRKKMAIKASAASAICASVLTARLPMRMTASITTASTAALMP